MKGAVGCLALVASACWSQPVSTETASVTPQAPAPRTSAADPDGVTTNAAGQATLVLAPTGPTIQPSFRLDPPVQRLLPGGVVAVAPSAISGNPRATAAVVRLTFPTGGHGGRNGLALLAADAVAQLADAAAGRPPLRARVELWGGAVRTRVGARSTSFEIVVPTEHWRRALDALVRTITAPPSGGAELERLRSRVARQLRTRLEERRVGNLIDIRLRSDTGHAEELVSEVEDRTAQDLNQFHSSAYRPTGAVLAVWVPAMPVSEVLDAAAAALVPWTGEAATEFGASTPVAPAFEASGVFWAPSADSTSETALLVRRPNLAEPHAVETWTLLECLTLDGLGGRLGREIAADTKTEVGLRGHDVWDGSTRYLALEGDAPPERASGLWKAHQRAWASLRRDPPRGAELRRAAERVRLRLLAEQTDPVHWIESVTEQVLGGRQPIDLNPLLARLENPSSLELDAALAADHTAAVFVAGGATPADAGDLEITELSDAFLVPRTDPIPVDIGPQMVAAHPFLRHAMREAGGQRLLREVNGFAGAATRHSDRGAAADEVIWFSAPDRYRAVRTVLATTIETVLGPDDQRVEHAGPDKLELGEDDARNILLEVKRYPLMLLAGFARGELRFRLVSVRSVGDREMAVLELIDPTNERLRMSIDTKSGLVRSVETLEWRPALRSRVEVVDSYSDYRNVGGLRLPFHRATVIDDGNTVTTSWRDLRPETPDPRYFELGSATALPPR